MKKSKYLLSLIILTCALSFTSCGATFNMGSRLKKLEIGMTKSEVIKILGNSYDVVGARETPDGTIEIWRYTGVNMSDGNPTYIVNILNGRLVEWFAEPTHRNYD